VAAIYSIAGEGARKNLNVFLVAGPMRVGYPKA
jgi:hypothetical protein